MLESQNPWYGFFGSVGEPAEVAWPIALTLITEATHCDEAEVRGFLDSRHGRQFADTVLTTSQAWCSPVHAKAGNLFFPAQAGIFYFWRWMLEKITPNSGSLMPPPVVRLHSRIMPWATWNSPDTLTLSPLPRD